VEENNHEAYKEYLSNRYDTQTKSKMMFISMALIVTLVIIYYIYKKYIILKGEYSIG